jgi:hypothetical protein
MWNRSDKKMGDERWTTHIVEYAQSYLNLSRVLDRVMLRVSDQEYKSEPECLPRGEGGTVIRRILFPGRSLSSEEIPSIIY